MLYCFTRNGAVQDRDLHDNNPTSAQRKNLEALASFILEPLWQHFPHLVIARGFMTRRVAYFNQIDPKSDYCLGQSVDIVCHDRNHAHFMYTFIRLNCEFNEMFFLPDNKNPKYLHVSYAIGKNANNLGGDVFYKKTLL